ncbi:MAG: hypothetical protein JXA11_04610 [Phycisphaerae bacterium]|nr:hypothetical protein [Phycisphaerae bacterium]
MRMYWTCIAGILCVALVGAASADSAAGEFIDGMSIQPTGWMKTPEGIEMGVELYGREWNLSRQVLKAVTPKGAPITSPGRWSLVGEFAGFHFLEKISAKGPNRIRYHAAVKSPSGVQTNQLLFAVTLPMKLYQGKTILCDGKPLTLPKEYQKEFFLEDMSVKTVEIPTESGRLVFRHEGNVVLQDPRKYGDQYHWFTIRFLFSPAGGVITKSSIDLEIELQPYNTEPISIAAQANMGFADEEAADGKGGWTDQGPGNDISVLPVGPRRLGGVLFDILDPKSNGGKSCLIFSGPNRPGFLKSVAIPVKDKTFAQLYLLHAIAWSPKEFGPIGQIRVDYADGSGQTIDVRFDRDVSNWWNVLPTKNGDTVWTATNQSTAIGLYLSRFAVENKPIRRLTLETNQRAVWMVVGVSGGESVPRLFVPNPVYTLAGDAWTPYTYDLTVQPGSIMDFSFLNHAPAGKFGRVIATKDGNFAFSEAPEKLVRFSGANLCYSANFQDKPACERLAENVARMGYNSIRFHHFDCGLGNFSNADCALNTTELDKLDYLFYCLKQKGVYVTIDLFSDRAVAKGLIPEAPGIVHHDIKALIPILDSAMKNWQAYTKSLLTHVNPYTKLAWKDDPALLAICVDNEDNINHWSNEWQYVRELYDRKFEEWLQEKGKTSLDAAARQVARKEFLAELQLNAYRKCREFIRSLGCQTLLTDVNFRDDYLTKYVRPELDYVDQHAYCAAPATIHRAEGLPIRSNQDNNLKNDVSFVSGLFNSRVFGRPFMVTEFNMPFPNRYRAQNGVTMGAYAALQDWDGLYRFAYAHTPGNSQHAGTTVWMELTQDPISLLSERIGILLFRRGDVSPARQAVPVILNRREILNRDTIEELKDYTKLGLRYRTGQWDVANPGTAPESVLTALGFSATAPIAGIPYRALSKQGVEALLAANEPRPGWITSDTKQVSIQPSKGQMAVVTDATECFLLERNVTQAGKVVAVENQGAFSVLAVCAMDEGKNLADARRMLLFHLTDSTNSAAKFFDEERTITEEWGTLPHLVRRAAAVVKLRLNPKQTLRAWAISMSGERKNEIPVQKTADGFEITIDTKQPTGGCMTYELAVEPAE